MKSFEREQRVREEGRREGLSEGRREGLSEGKAEGLSEGRREGLSEGKRTAAINLKAMNMPIEQIAQALEENVEVVEQWLVET